MKTTHEFQIGLCSFTVCVKIHFPVLEMQFMQIFPHNLVIQFLLAILQNLATSLLCYQVMVHSVLLYSLLFPLTIRGLIS